jgi:hypothetical protein
VADEMRQAGQPPLEPPSDIPLKGQRCSQRVAVGAVVCDVNLKTPLGPTDPLARCPQGSPTEWQWAGIAWICIGGGARARKPARTDQSVSAVDSAATNEQPMSRAEATE